MRTSLLLFLFIVSSFAGLCQTSSQEDGERVVRAALDLKSDAIYSGVMEKQLNRMGDAAAVAVTRVLANQELTADEINRILTIARMSFAAPKIVEIKSDRHPRTTLFLLRFLACSATDQGLKKRIADTAKFVEEAAKAATE